MCCYWTVANVGHNGSVKDEPKETNFLKILDFGSIKCGRRGISLSLDWTLSMETQLHYLNGLENGKCRGSQLCKVQLLMIENIVISSLSLSLSLSLYLPLSIYLPLFWKPRKGTKKFEKNFFKKSQKIAGYWTVKVANNELMEKWKRRREWGLVFGFQHWRFHSRMSSFDFLSSSNAIHDGELILGV